uniref:Uncharacterized protein n=1 Tax=Lepeophtheirus salmonis TaxID=72036 RepID=A0A0K2U4C3_LEPSM
MALCATQPTLQWIFCALSLTIAS